MLENLQNTGGKSVLRLEIGWKNKDRRFKNIKKPLVFGVLIGIKVNDFDDR